MEGYWFNTRFSGTTLARVWWPYLDTATYMGKVEPP